MNAYIFLSSPYLDNYRKNETSKRITVIALKGSSLV